MMIEEQTEGGMKVLDRNKTYSIYAKKKTKFI
jgi:hypothetical protein